jgi:ribonuclease HI
MHNDPHNSAIKVLGPYQSNQVSEIVAIIEAISATPPFQPLTIISDSPYAIEGLTEHLSIWENISWIGIQNATFFKKAIYLLKKHTAETHFKWVKGHSENKGNNECNRLAKMSPTGYSVIL